MDKSDGQLMELTGQDLTIQEANTAETQPAPLIQGDTVQIAGGHFTVIGRDSHTHVHYHGSSDVNTLGTILQAIANHRKIQQDTLVKATLGTVEWLLKSYYFHVWWDVNGDIQILWGTGIPGAGKTILVSIVIDEIERQAEAANDGQICVAYYYMRYSEQSQVSIRGILEVLVKQTLERHQDLLPLAAVTYDRHIREGTEPTGEQLLGLLRTFSERKAVTFYFLDALDEAPVDIQLDLVEKLASLNARIFITSRPMKDVQGFFPDARCFEIIAHERDLDLHINKRLQGIPRLRVLFAQGHAAQRDLLVAEVKRKCGGMFLHASLQLDALRRCSTIRSVMETLDRFPAKIEDVYHQTWERIIGQEAEHATLAKAALLWVLYARRSLTIQELCHAIATSPVTHKFEEDRLIPETTIIDLCHGLLAVDRKSKLVRLVHYTAKSPVEDLLRQDFPHPHSIIATVCLTHLTDCGFQHTSFVGKKLFNAALMADPLLAYAYDAWAFHGEKCLDLESTASQVEKFIEGSQSFPVILYGFRFDIIGPVHVAVFYHLPVTLAGSHLADGVNAPTQKEGLTPLGLACHLGNHTAAQSLLRLPNVLVNATDGDGVTTLLLACRNGDLKTAQLLLSHPDIGVNLADDDGDTALMLVCAKGRDAIVKLLLAHPAINVNLVNELGQTSLMIACANKRESAVQLLLDHPSIDVNLADNEGDTAITIASRAGWREIVEKLVGVPNLELNTVHPQGTTALLAAAEGGFVDVVELLLTVPNIDANVADDDGETALKAAAAKGHEDVVCMLLEVPGIDTSVASTYDGHTAMSAAAANVHSAVVVRLEEFEARRASGALYTSAPVRVLKYDAKGDIHISCDSNEAGCVSDSDSDGDIYEDALEML